MQRSITPLGTARFGAAPLLYFKSAMTRFMPKSVLYLAVAAALSVFGGKANAQFLSSAPEMQQMVNHTDALQNSWVPYQAEFPEVSGYLRLALNSQIGISPGGYASSSSAALDAGAGLCQGASGPGIPQDKVELSWLNLFLVPLPAADTGSSTSSPSSPERTDNPQTGLLDHQQIASAESVTWLAARRQVLPGTPLSARLFRPPRAAA